jgi:hypothetical protein
MTNDFAQRAFPSAPSLCLQYSKMQECSNSPSMTSDSCPSRARGMSPTGPCSNQTDSASSIIPASLTSCFRCGTHRRTVVQVSRPPWSSMWRSTSRQSAPWAKPTRCSRSLTLRTIVSLPSTRRYGHCPLLTAKGGYLRWQT